MANLFYGDMLPPPRERPVDAEAETVLVGTSSAVPIKVERIDHHLAPDGTACVGSFLHGKLIGRCAVPAETAEEFLEMELFHRPVALALNVRAGGPGLEGNLLALVPAAEARGVEEEDEPWKGSVPGSGYEEEGEGHLVGIFLGQVVRFGEDRRFPDSLVREAADMLAGVVRGRIGNVVDRLIENLSGSQS